MTSPEILHLFDDPSRFGASPVATVVRARDANARALTGSLAGDGFVRLSALEDGDAAALVDAIEQLHARAIHPLFAYVHQPFWAIGEALAARVSEAVGTAYRLVEDVWAFRVEPGVGRGWAPHRGIDATLLSRARPEVLNVWVSLSDAEEERACMHAVPLPSDPSYPGALARIDVPREAAVALPTSAGEALVWNANLLHWGGECAPGARGPRIACTYTLATASFAEAHGYPLARVEGVDHAGRLDMIARMIRNYDEIAGVDDRLRDWAKARLAFLAFAARKDR